ncbi:MAG: hypothetical protein Q7S27_07440 [Nanoarchaeota archaeon]|nr:hypothetical protein [Nanoarchaeota archaeon]
MIRKIARGICARKLVMGLCLWAGLYLTVDYLNVQRNREAYLANPVVYSSQDDFLKGLELEKQKLGLENIDISCEDDIAVQGGHSFKIDSEKYVIKFNPIYKSRKVLRHELYHIKKWESFSLDDLLDGFLFGQYEEWRATNYSLKTE